MNVHKITLSSGKVVLLKEFKMKHQELALKAAGNRAGGNANLHNFYVSQELVKILLAQVDGKTLTPAQAEDLDEVFSLAEFSQVQKAIQKLSGMDEGDADPKYEMIAQ